MEDVVSDMFTSGWVAHIASLGRREVLGRTKQHTHTLCVRADLEATTILTLLQQFGTCKLAPESAASGR
eukprot:1107536-Amphidinium_carterae.1